MKKQNTQITNKGKKVIFLPFIIFVFIGFLFINANAQNYCKPFNGSQKARIRSFDADGGLGSSYKTIHNNSASQSIRLYADNTSKYVEAVAGDSLNHKIVFTNDDLYYTIWIDWDNDNFDSKDIMVQGKSNGKLASPGYILNNIKPGDYRLRIRVAENKFPNDPCKNNTTILTGETHDYTVIILAKTDAAIDRLMSPDINKTLCSTAKQEIKVRIVNQGIDDLNKVKVNWSLNGVTQSPQTFNFNPVLRKGYDETVSIAKQSFLLNAQNDIQVWTEDPNGKTDENEDNDTLDFIITVDPLPSVSSIQNSKQNDDSYDFIAKGISDVSTYNWDFGDGNNSTQQSPNHKYMQSNTYTVTLIVSNNCGSDTITTKVNYAALGITQNQLNKQLQLYPNPASDIVILKTGSDKNISSVAVYNMLGKEVYQRTINNKSTVQLDVNNYSSGIYSISIEMTDGTWIQHKFQVIK